MYLHVYFGIVSPRIYGIGHGFSNGDGDGNGIDNYLDGCGIGNGTHDYGQSDGTGCGTLIAPLYERSGIYASILFAQS